MLSRLCSGTVSLAASVAAGVLCATLSARDCRGGRERGGGGACRWGLAPRARARGAEGDRFVCVCVYGLRGVGTRMPRTPIPRTSENRVPAENGRTWRPYIHRHTPTNCIDTYAVCAGGVSGEFCTLLFCWRAECVIASGPPPMA
jgi:hypothetical protein